MSDFDGFPGIGKGTVVPNLFFAAVLPEVHTPGALLAFLWASRLLQEKRGDTRFVTAAEIWAQPAAEESFANLAGGEKGLKTGLSECVELRALLAIGLRSAGSEEVLFESNDPASRRTIARARAGEITLRQDSIVVPIEPKERRPGIFRLYEENIGTITAMVGERLLEAQDRYPADWIEDAFREAAELNARNWRYIETILRNWAEEGRPHETPGRDSLEDRKRKYLGGALRPGS